MPKKYSISFDLLLPRLTLLRLDIFPYLILYAILAHQLYENFQDENMNLYIRLSFIGVGFLHCIIPIYCRSHLYFRVLVQKNASNYSV